MSLSDELERLLPRLRRFARAATADKVTADACIERAIHQLIDGNIIPVDDRSLSNQTRLYRTLERELEREAEGSFDRRAWRALILVFVEGFSEHETGQILGVGQEVVSAMVASAEKSVKTELSKR